MTVGLVAVNFRSNSLLASLMAGLAMQTNGDWRLIVVDNSESDEEFEGLVRVARDDHRVRVLCAPQNLGYLNAFGYALNECDLSDCQWVGLCNMDLEFYDREFVQHLSQLNEDALGVVAPAIMAASAGADANPYLRERPSRASVLKSLLLFSSLTIARFVVILSLIVERVGGVVLARSAEVSSIGCDIYAAHGSCFFVSRKYLQKGGVTSHRVLLFAEELTVAESCRCLGLRVAYRPSLRVRHIGQATTGRWRTNRVLKLQRESTRYAWQLLFGSE
jgi:GT2 family glycosyltransferase